ncbi:MAG: hypothetical protein ABSH40_11095, partial [Bryobacteraceae bacterium]
MSPPSAHKLRSILSQSGWEKATQILQKLDPAVAADALLDVPFEEQRELYRRLPIPFAASLTAEFPYYHAYVLLHSRPLDEMNQILDHMSVSDSLQFIEQLPEDAWGHLIKEMAEKPAPAAPVEAPAPAVEPIIEARKIEKSYERP